MLIRCWRRPPKLGSSPSSSYGIPKDGVLKFGYLGDTEALLTICHGVALHPDEEVRITNPLHGVIHVRNCSQSDLSVESVYHPPHKSERYGNQEQENATDVAPPTSIQ